METLFVDAVNAGTVAVDFAATPNVSAEPDNAVCGKAAVFGVTFFNTCTRALARFFRSASMSPTTIFLLLFYNTVIFNFTIIYIYLITSSIKV